MKHVIIGNGPAGVVAAETLRKLDPDCDITLLGDEPEPPYSRMALPYLMMGEINEAGTYLRKDAGHFERLRIEQLQDRATAVDIRARNIKLSNGTSLGYDRLLIATGSHPIKPPIPGIDLPGVHACWTMDDARRIIADAAAGTHVVQIGAGFIGCIILEALVTRKVRLTLLEMGKQMVPRMMTPAAGAMIRKWCEERGVEVRVDAHVTAIERIGNGAHPLRVKLATGDAVETEMVIVAAGVAPNVDFLRGSGITCKSGIPVDATMQTNVSGVYAAGDVAEALNFSTGLCAMNAIQPSAVEQARLAALNMAGRHTESRGNLTLNVLDTIGLVSTSLGKWQGKPSGQSVELIDDDSFRYLSLQFEDDVLVGATSIGLTEHVGVLRGLIEGRVQLGPWKDRLLREPLLVMEAYLDRTQATA
jgi:NAD(P)H-nitrite reductase large subunit